MTYQSGHNNTGAKDRRIKELEQQLRSAQLQVHKLKSQLEEANEEIRTIKERYIDMEEIYKACEAESPILATYLRTIFQNLHREKNGRRYSELRNFVALLSFFGERAQYILHRALMLPHVSTAKKYRKQALLDFGIDELIFNGKPENIEKIVNLNSTSDTNVKAVLMIDACYVTPYVGVRKDGTTYGFVDDIPVPPDLIEKIIEDEEEFRYFLHEHQESIIRAEFVFMVASINTPQKPYPVYCLPANSGTATRDIHTIITRLVNNLEKFNIRVMGPGTDGDLQYVTYSSTLVQHIIKNYTDLYNGPFVDFCNSIDSLFHFSDPFHLVKRDRYRKIRKLFFNCSPTTTKYQHDCYDFEDIGVPRYVVDDEKARKMEDSLPQRLFSAKVIHSIFKKGDIPFLTCMLPSALLLDAIHNERLRRQERIDELLFGASIILLYYLCISKLPEHYEVSGLTHESHGQADVPFDTNWCYEYISATFSISYMLATEKVVNLGSCGTHPLEHLFGNIRRLSNGDDTDKTFKHALKCFLAESELCKSCGINPDHVARRSDSGVIVTDDPIESEIYFLKYLQAARRLMNNFVTFSDGMMFKDINMETEKMSLDECAKMLPQFSEIDKISISTKSTGIISTGGLGNIKKWVAGKQINKY